MVYDQKKYLTYKKKQKALNRKQISLVVEEKIANALQKELKGKNKIIFEHKLKLHFLKKRSSELLKKIKKSDLDKLIHNIDLLLPNLQEQLSESNKTIKILEQRLNLFMKMKIFNNQDNGITNVNIKNLAVEAQSLEEISPKNILTVPKNKKVHNEILDLAIELYKDLKSWTKVSQELAKKGYLSRKNTPYTGSNLSRSVSKYKNEPSNQ